MARNGIKIGKIVARVGIFFVIVNGSTGGKIVNLKEIYRYASFPCALVDRCRWSPGYCLLPDGVWRRRSVPPGWARWNGGRPAISRWGRVLGQRRREGRIGRCW